MKTNNKTIFQRFKSSIKSGWEMPILPDHIIELDKNIYIRMLKIIGPLTENIINYLKEDSIILPDFEE